MNKKEEFKQLTFQEGYSKGSNWIFDHINYGTDYDDNYTAKTPVLFAVGSAYTQGNEVRSFFDLNQNGPVLYNPTQLDETNITTTFSSIFINYPNLTNYPYLSDEYPYDQTQIENNSKESPIFKFPGKGFGEIEFYQSGNQTNGLIEYCEPMLRSFYYTNIFHDRIQITDTVNYKEAKYPFNGMIYSGNLVQLQIQPNVDDNTFSNVKVILYQNGRGIPQYDPTKEYFSGNAYGIPLWQDISFQIEPELSMGSVPGSNNSCLGVSLDSFATNTSETVYKYKVPSGYTLEELNDFPWIKWHCHPAPFTAPSVDTSFTLNSRILSPENSNNNYYAPWPNYYAYHTDDAIPVLSSGFVTCLIGSSINIGSKGYYEPDVVEGDDPRNNPNYVSISIVPLFQGEEIKVGSQVYANAMGHVITPLPVGTTPYPVATYDDASGNVQGLVNFRTAPASTLNSSFFGVQRDARRDNPWYDWFDATYGSVGWTSTPNFILSNIPDEGVAVIQSRDGTSLNYMNQSNQGSIIIQASTTVNPATVNGSGRMTLIGQTGYDNDNNNISMKFARINKFPGNAENALSVGYMNETITGTGQWPYTGTINNFEQSTYAHGFGYSNSTYNVREIGGATIEMTSVDSNGSVLTFTLNSAGTGYQIGDLVTATNTSLNWAEGTIRYYENSASFQFVTLVSLVANLGGSNYQSSLYEKGYNISANNLLLTATARINTNFVPRNGIALISFITNVSIFNVTDVSRYPVGTEVALVNGSNPSNWATVLVDSNDGVNITVQLYRIGGRNVYQTGTYLYSTKIVGYHEVGSNYNTVSLIPFPEVSIAIQASDGIVTEIQMIDIPNQNKDGDLILVHQSGSDLNCIFQLDSDVSNIVNFSTKLIKGGAGYFHNPIIYADAITMVNIPSADDTLTNRAQILNPGGIYSGADVFVGWTSPGFLDMGTLTNISYFPNTPTYTGQFGDIQTISQSYPINLSNQPDGGGGTTPIPANGWPSFVFRNTATFYQDVRFFIAQKGTGYTVGGPFNVSGGSGINMTVYVVKVDSNGGIEKLKVANIGSGYLKEDNVIVLSGNNDSQIILKLPITRELDVYFSRITEDILYPFLHFNPVIINGGSGYSVGGPFTTNCPVYDVNTLNTFNINVNILSVDGSGAILDLEIVLPPTDISAFTGYFGYQLGYNIIVDGGNNDSLIKLSTPIKADKIEFTNGGTNYVTASNVSTFNLSQNNLVVICGLETTGVGECEVIDYSSSDLKPSFWDLTRYTVGDIIAFNQNGNISATAEITSINVATRAITFNQLTVGVGYTNSSGAYAFLPTINLSQTATTLDIVSSNGSITSVVMNTLGTNTEYNDYLIIEGGDNNAVIQISSERDVPPDWQIFENGRNATAAEWNTYKTALRSSVNLLDHRAMIHFEKHYPNYYNNSWYYYGDPDNKDPYTAGLAFLKDA